MNVWTENIEKARAIQAAVGRPCVMIQSPYGMDANDLLVTGVLVEFLARVEGPEFSPKPQQDDSAVGQEI